jgi:hypothetical protein
MKINVLGTEYTVNVLSKKEDTFLENCDGYCDKTTKKIVVKAEDESDELGNYAAYLKKIKRHEIIHAFLFESGLQENFKHDGWGHDETMIDWVAVQFPKMIDAFKAADAL